MKQKFAIILTLAFGALIMLSFSINSFQSKPWTIPAKYKSMKNPAPGDKASIAMGKLLWTKHCKSCHGSVGAGDGTKATSLKTKMNDFSSKAVQSATDGELYYKSFVGRDEMPNYEKKIIDEEERWAIINFIRTMAK
jgi:mono/diheme cytochrome c family protein